MGRFLTASTLGLVLRKLAKIFKGYLVVFKMSSLYKRLKLSPNKPFPLPLYPLPAPLGALLPTPKGALKRLE